MTNEALKNFLAEQFPGCEVTEGAQYIEMLVPAEQLYQTGARLKELDETSFDYLFCLSGVDYPDHIKVVYHLESTRHRHTMVLKVKTADRVDSKIDSVSEIWRTAKYHEREVYDLLGLKFNNHSDLRRLFLEDGWGFPLRKDYVDQVRIVER
jgi:NADH:ubiquinone oxidoreductase subunit C